MSVDDPERCFAIRFSEGVVETGPVVDLRETEGPTDPTAAQLRRAIRSGCPTGPAAPAVHAPAPGRIHAYVSHLAFDTTFRTRPALAAVAADRGIETPHDDDLSDAIGSLRTVPPAPVDDAELGDARRRAAEAGAETERLRERVAAVRGRVTALRDATPPDDEAVAAAEASLSETTRRLSEVATEHVAASQRLALLEDRARSARDRRDVRLRLEDRIGNLERAVRAARVDAVEDDFHEARRTLRSRIGDVEAGTDVSTMTDDCVDALAVTRIAPLRAPLVLAADVAVALGGPDPAFEVLDAPLLIR